MTHPTPPAVIAAARSWIGTRFHHQGRLKKTDAHAGGVDCLGLLVGIARELDVRDAAGVPLAERDRVDYGHLPNGAALLAGLAGALVRLPEGELPPGSIVLIALEDEPRHVAIVGNTDGDGWRVADESTPSSSATRHASQLTLIHAYAQARAVVEHALDDWWRERIVAAFALRSDA